MMAHEMPAPGGMEKPMESFDEATETGPNDDDVTETETDVDESVEGDDETSGVDAPSEEGGLDEEGTEDEEASSEVG
jgi:hypothetical protein